MYRIVRNVRRWGAVCRYSKCSKVTPRRFSTKPEKDIKEVLNATPTNTKVKAWWAAAPAWKKFGVLVVVGGVTIVYTSYVMYLKARYDQHMASHGSTSQRTYGELSVGGPFELVDTKGNIVSSESLKGQWVILYFGFTYCPDICPEQMEMLGNLVDIAKNEHDIDITPIMITIDPERDTPEVLDEYISDYNSKIIGLTGTDEQLDIVCNAFRCYRTKGQAYDDPNDYILDHTVTQYLIDPEGRVVGYFLSNRDLEARVPILLDHVKRYYESKEVVQ